MIRTILASCGMVAGILMVPLTVSAADRPDPVDIRVFLSQSAVRPGDRFKIAVEITTKGKYHIYGPRTSENGLVSSSISMEAVEGLMFGAPRFPPTEKLVVKPLGMEFDVYEGRVRVIIPVIAGGILRPGRLTVQGRLRYQACTDTSCLAPSGETFSIQVPVVAEGTMVDSRHPEVFAPTQENTVVIHVEGMT